MNVLLSAFAFLISVKYVKKDLRSGVLGAPIVTRRFLLLGVAIGGPFLQAAFSIADYNFPGRRRY